MHKHKEVIQTPKKERTEVVKNNNNNSKIRKLGYTRQKDKEIYRWIEILKKETAMIQNCIQLIELERNQKINKLLDPLIK